jgi:hypothetical protein
METPKPKPPVKKPVPTAPKKEGQQAKQVKKANFKLKQHLTHRPFSDEALFKKLREQAQPESMRPQSSKPIKKGNK